MYIKCSIIAVCSYTCVSFISPSVARRSQNAAKYIVASYVLAHSNSAALHNCAKRALDNPDTRRACGNNNNDGEHVF